MAVVELHIPSNLFDSAKAENSFESVSERISKAFIKDILNELNVRRGDDKINEPDYMVNKKGYEVTFAVDSKIIQLLKGVKELDDSLQNIEEELIKAISEATERKANKNYSCISNLVIITISTMPTWYIIPNLSKECNLIKKYWDIIYKTRNNLFEKLYRQYIALNTFENIYIIQPTFDGKFALFNIKDFAINKNNFLTIVTSSNTRMFPTYKLIDAETPEEIKSLKIKIVNYKINK
ncbi:hypothetical protein [Amedibacterium intestinale]|uniref:Uncharacterized protein n=1 Tax=Amedibacterium intestinale TaxID=2583452 RepID=A0A6N4TGC0_9FIRM|nr:hypothetical protein [Amedibacterium intestinale]RHO29391.1 hypothetical protein DW208_07490 [Erysipelotrichaceae bacterium AM17-60]BBK21948.1 hypothetical protein Aargi30884_08510 [Amedibacterium intestinale]